MVNNRIFILWVVATLLALTNCELKLIDSRDFLYVVDNNNTTLFEHEISGFKNYKNFTKNTTIENAGICNYKDDTITLETFNSYCGNKAPDVAEWILTLQFSNSNFPGYLTFINENYKNFTGNIFTYSDNIQIESGAEKYENISIISFAQEGKISKYYEYALPESQDVYKGRLKHTFVNNCSMMDPMYIYYVIVLCLWALVLLVHSFWTWVYMREYSFSLQKIMVSLPSFFIAVVMLDYLQWKACPWLDLSSSQYLQIVNIALDTIFNTLFVGFCLFVSRGWKIVKNTFEREELSRITLVVGIFYLVYSAYFIASDIESLKVIIIIALAIMYTVVMMFCYSNCHHNLKAINYHIRQARFSQIVLNSLKLKLYLMRWFRILCTSYFANKILFTLFYEFITNNFVCRAMLVINLYIELVIIILLMILLRTRKWMELFSLDVIMPNSDDPNQVSHIAADILTAQIPKNWVLDHDLHKGKSDLMVNNRQITKFKKNSKYLLAEQAVLLDYSETQWSAINRDDDENIKLSIYGTTHLGTQEEVSDDD